MGSKCNKCVRIFFFIFNFLFWLLGLLSIGIGVYSRIQTDAWKELVDSNTIYEASNLLIIAGGKMLLQSHCKVFFRHPAFTQKWKNIYLKSRMVGTTRQKFPRQTGLF